MKRLIGRHQRVLVVALACVALGAGIGAITSAGATTTHGATATTTAKSTKSAKSATSAKSAKTAKAKRRGPLARLERAARRSVQTQAVVDTKRGFVTVSIDRGSVTSVSGQQLTVDLGTAKASYKTVTLTIPSTARVRVNGQPSSLSALIAGQRVLVFTGPEQTVVVAHTPKPS